MHSTSGRITGNTALKDAAMVGRSLKETEGNFNGAEKRTKP